MKSIAALFMKLLGVLLASILLGGLWWRLWMYHGWPGSPAVIPRLLGEDGEGAYQALMDEMILICGILLYGLLVTHHFVAKSRETDT